MCLSIAALSDAATVQVSYSGHAASDDNIEALFEEAKKFQNWVDQLLALDHRKIHLTLNYHFESEPKTYIFRTGSESHHRVLRYDISISPDNRYGHSAELPYSVSFDNRDLRRTVARTMLSAYLEAFALAANNSLTTKPNWLGVGAESHFSRQYEGLADSALSVKDLFRHVDITSSTQLTFDYIRKNPFPGGNLFVQYIGKNYGNSTVLRMITDPSVRESVFIPEATGYSSQTVWNGFLAHFEKLRSYL